MVGSKSADRKEARAIGLGKGSEASLSGSGSERLDVESSEFVN